MSEESIKQSDTRPAGQMPGIQAAEPSRRAKAKVALVEDEPKIRESGTRLINSFPDFCCVCACATGEAALRVIPEVQPDAVLMDISLPRMSGIECTARLKALLPDTPVVILTDMDDRDLVFMAFKAGADGYLLKQTKPDDLRTALIDVLGGGVPMTCKIARCVIESFRRKAGFLDASSHFSTREEQILMLLCQGYGNRLVAERLNLSVNTVCAHLKRVFKKLDVSSRTEAVVRYLASKPSQHESAEL